MLLYAYMLPYLALLAWLLGMLADGYMVYNTAMLLVSGELFTAALSAIVTYLLGMFLYQYWVGLVD